MLHGFRVRAAVVNDAQRLIELQLLLANRKRLDALGPTSTQILTALDSNVKQVRLAARRLLPSLLPAPKSPGQGARLSLLGKLDLEVPQIEARLEALGVELVAFRQGDHACGGRRWPKGQVA